MKIRKHLMFFPPDGVPSAVGNMPMPQLPPDPVTPEDPNDSIEVEAEFTPDPELEEGAPTPTRPEVTPVEPVAPGTFQMTPETLAAALRAAGIGAPAAPVVQPAAPLTPEQRTAMLKELKRRSFNDPAFLTKLNNMETQGQALEELQDGIVEHVTQIMATYMNQERQGIMSQVSPALKFAQDYQTREQFGRFNVAYKELANPALEPIRDLAIQQLNASGTKFNSEAEIFSGVAKAMEKLIQAGNPQFKLSSGSTPVKQTNAITPRPSRGGGGGGPVSSNTQPSGVPKAVSFMPKVGK